MKKIAYLTVSDPTGFHIYDHLTFPHLRDLGWSVEEVPWDIPQIDWRSFSAVVIRSTWDYQKRSAEFLQVLETIERSGTPLLNNLAIVRWNMEKTYLRELESAGVAVVPTAWMPGFKTEKDILALFDNLKCTEIVIKPTIGANADDTFRCHRDQIKTYSKDVLRAFENRPAMVQPFLQSIVSDGECSLFYFQGVFSHAVLKKPAKGDFRVQEEHGGIITALKPSPEQVKAGQRAMDALPAPCLYARMDLGKMGTPSI